MIFERLEASMEKQKQTVVLRYISYETAVYFNPSMEA